jgi:hypothetical protein
MSHQFVLLELRHNISLFCFDLLETHRRKSDKGFISGGTERCLLSFDATLGEEILFGLVSIVRNLDC